MCAVISPASVGSEQADCCCLLSAFYQEILGPSEMHFLLLRGTGQTPNPQSLGSRLFETEVHAEQSP